MHFRLAGFLSVLTLFALALPGAASAAVGDVDFKSCVSETGSSGACDDGRALDGSFDVVVSPDGKHAYASSHFSHAVSIFDRAPDGKLTQRDGASGCVSDEDIGAGCAVSPPLRGPRTVLVSPDGRHVYVALQNSNAVAAFDRDSTTGNLTRKPGIDGCISENGSSGLCRDGRSLIGAIGMAFSPDARQVYVSQSQGVTVLRRGADGALTQAADPTGCVSENGQDSDANVGACTDGRFLGQSYQIAVAPDGKHVYVTHDGFVGSTNVGLLVFNRDPDTGAIVQPAGLAGCIASDGHPASPGNAATNQCLTNAAFDSNTWTTNISPDGKFVYAVMNTGIIAFARNADTGALSQVQCLRSSAGAGCTLHTGFTQFFSGAVSPDLKDFVALEWNSSGGLHVYDRDSQTGLLAKRAGLAGCITRNGSGGACRTAPMLGDSGLVDFSPDNASILAGFRGTDAVVTFRRDVAPACEPVSASVPHNASAPVGLRCSDLNDDPITYEIAEGPFSGLLGAVDQSARTVRYSPFSNYSGPDSFKYRGVAAGVTSAPATASLTVAAPSAGGGDPGGGPGGGSAGRVTSGVSHKWRASAKYTRVRSLAVRSAPAGAVIEVRCKGRGCPLKLKRIDVSQAGTVNLAKLFNFKRKGRKIVSKLRVKTVVEVRVLRGADIGKVVRFTMRKRKAPKAKTLCMPPGASKPQAC